MRSHTRNTLGAGRPVPTFGRVAASPSKGLYKPLDISGELTRPNRTVIPNNSPEQAVLLEVDRMLVVWSMSASFINALAIAPGHDAELKGHAKFSAKPLIFAAVTSFDGELLRAMPAASEIATFYQALDQVRVHHALVFAPDVARTAADIQDLVAESKSITQMALRLVTALQQVDLTMDGASWTTEMVQVRDLLTQVAAGETPCNDGAKVVFPDWTRGRRSVRRWLGAEARIRLADGWHKVMVTDISEGGIGIQSACDLAEGDSVTIEFDTGRIMVGNVARTSKPNKYGIKLHQRLPACDPLLSS
jgi:PilZ domain